MPRRGNPEDQRPDGTNRQDEYIRERKRDDRPPRDDKQPDTPAEPTRRGGLSGGRWKK